MSTGFNNQHIPPSPFDGPNFKGDDYTFHVIVTDHPYMHEIGLGAFTTGQLYEWASQVDKKDGKTYKNLASFANGKLAKIQKRKNPDDKLDPAICSDIINLKIDNVTTSNYFFSAWRENAVLGGGEYIEQKDINKDSSNWRYKSFSFDELIFHEFDNAKVKTPDFESNASGNIEIIQRTNSFGSGINSVDLTISNIIEMNDYVRLLRIAKPRADWTNKDKARSEFILDIKSSFEKCVTWSGIMPFRLNLGVATNTNPNDEIDDNKACIKEEMVTFKLFLFDEKFAKEHARKVTMNELIFVAPKSDSFGRIGNKQNGEVNPVSRGLRPQDSVAGVLDLQWNEFEGKWISGTPQVLAIMSVTAPSAKIPSLDQIKTTPIKQLLTPGTQAIVTVGSAIPLTMQNGNPFQLSPEYKTTKDCRSEDDIIKNEVRVYNRFPRPWTSGEIVMLSKIDGVWQPSVVGDIIEEKQADAGGFLEKWSFSYFMTNVDFLNWEVRDINQDGGINLDTETKRFTYQDYEKAFRSAYYYNDSDQESIVEGKWVELVDFGKKFLQVTSFDFMGPQIGGINTANALGNTHILFDTKTLPMSEDPMRIYATKTAPFFGCVFPDGYKDDGRITNYINGEYNTSCVFDGDLTKVPKIREGKSANMEQSDWILPIDPADDDPSKADLLVFSNNNTNRYSDGMFAATGEEGDILFDSTLSHLPADIALNASPSGQYGSPIEIYDNELFVGIDEEEINYQKISDEYFQKRSYGAKKVWHGVNDTAISDSGAYSFWDFAPNNPNRIQFRPLKMDLYAFREFKTGVIAKNYLNNANPFYTKSNRGIWSAQLWETQSEKGNDLNFPISSKFFDDSKNFKRLQSLFPKNFGKLMDLPNSGMRYNPDFKRFTELGIPPTFNPVYNNANGLNIPEGVWNKDWCLSPTRGAGAFGIIGAQYTVSADNKISFNTESLIGQPPVFRGTPGSTTIGDIINTIINFVGINQTNATSVWSDTWKAGEFYDSHNTTALWVRVFAAWPREQTYYDPRSFGILHFNPFINGSYLDTRYGDKKDQSLELHDHVYAWTSGITTKTKWIDRGNSDIIIEKPNPPFSGGSLSPPQNERGYPSAWYINEVQLTDVDIRIPTYYDSETVGPNEIGKYIINDGLINGQITKPIRKLKEEWRIDTQRRGKLLPYKGKFLTIGFGTSEAANDGPFIEGGYWPLSHCTPETRQNGQSVKLINYDIFMVDGGKGHAVNTGGGISHYFTVEGGNGLLIEGLCESGILTGPITRFRLAKKPISGNLDTRGYGLMPDQFANSQMLNTSNLILPLKLIPTGSKTAGSTPPIAYITRGILLEHEFSDQPPREVNGGPWKLTPNPRPASDVNITYEQSRITDIDINAPTWVVDSFARNLYGLPQKKYSTNGQYDIFFRLHNDCSHTMSRTDRLGSFMNWYQQDMGPFENAVTVTVNGQ